MYIIRKIRYDFNMPNQYSVCYAFGIGQRIVQSFVLDRAH